MNASFYAHLQSQADSLREQGLFKTERVITSPQRAAISVQGGREVLNFCANNYLGLADHPELIRAAQEGLEKHGYGMSSGAVHLRHARRAQAARSEAVGSSSAPKTRSSSRRAGTPTAACSRSCSGEEDAVISDALNHASIIDGIRLCKAKRFRYANNDLKDLEAKLIEAKDARFKLVATDGVFSMDGVIAPLREICDLAEKYGAMVMVDDSHAVGFTGDNGRGTHELNQVMGRVDIITGTLGKALGGASGGYVSAKKEVVTLLRQRARPYLFSNTLMPAIAHTTLAALELLEKGDGLRAKLRENSAHFRSEMTKAGFKLAGAGHPIIPVMLGDAKLASKFAEGMLQEGIYVIGFSYPVVPQGQARIRTQMSAGHDAKHIDQAIAAFVKVGRSLGVV